MNRAPTDSEGESWSTIENTSSLDAQQQSATQQSKRRSMHAPPSSRRKTVGTLEVDEVPSTDSGLSWMRRVSWLQRGSSHRQKRPESSGTTINSLDYWLEYRPGSGDAYFGGTMDSGDHPMGAISPVEAIHGSYSMRDFPSPTANDAAARYPRSYDASPSIAHQSSFQRFSSWFSSNRRPPTKDLQEDDSVCDFHESEWTPPDTSYGAAIPVGGWIPKTIRRLIEWTLIGTVICCVAFLVISTSIKISGSESRSNSTIVSGMNYDEDPYNSYSYNYNRNNDDGGRDDDTSAAKYNTTAVSMDDDNVTYSTDDGSGDDSINSYGDNGGYNPDNDGSFFNYAYKNGGSN